MSVFIIIAVLLVFTSLFVMLSLFPYAGDSQNTGVEIKAQSRRQ